MPQDILPIALFCYNRPDHLRATLEALRNNHGVDRACLYAFSDGPACEADIPKVEAVRAMLADIDWCASVRIVSGACNKGLRDSIVQGVTTVVEQHGRCIVLEDDIVTSPWFLQYMDDALVRYRDVPDVMHIAGFFLPVSAAELPEAVFYRPTSCWGWATWADRWAKLELDAAVLLERLKGREEAFNLEGAYNFMHHLHLNVEGRMRTWAIFWYASVFLMGGQCLHPAVSLTRNIGHDGCGTNCRTTDSFETTLREMPVTEFPSVVEEHPLALERARQFYLCNRGKV